MHVVDSQPGWLDWVDRRASALLDACLPPRCVLCAARGQRRPVLDLCADCEAELPWLPAEPHNATLAAFRYAPPVDHLVQSLKYSRRLALARVLGTVVARSPAIAAALAGVDALVPMPLHPARAAARGFNQSLEIARWLGRGPGKPVASGLLRRLRDTPPQVGLDAAARRANVAGAFAATRHCRGLRLALVDDVVTSGASSGEAAAALEAKGAAWVCVIAVARA
jgi:ComF family protein